ncbi:MAG TPA: HAD-IB family phosphatase [Terriglobales bacterium]|jgi:HAD superfamily phosphoserine phosphatase-like hydrolase
MPSIRNTAPREFVVISDFDQTLSFNDSGSILASMIGVTGFEERVAGLSKIHLVQQGGELGYLLLHDPEFRKVRREHLHAVGKQVRLKANIKMLYKLLKDLDGDRFSFYVVSAAPEEVIQSALEGIVPADHIFGTQFRYAANGEIESIVCMPAGYGKVAKVDEIREHLLLPPHRIVYVGDGSSDVHVMLHVNRLAGLTIAVSENRFINQIAQRTILSDDALSVLIPVLEEIVGWDARRIRLFFEQHGFLVREWDKVHTDSLTITPTTAAVQGAGA